MVKSKFQAKVHEKVGVKTKVNKPKTKYYDEQMLKTQASKSNNSFAIFMFVCILIGASVTGIIILNNRPSEDPDPNGTGSGIQDGDTIVFRYEFFIDDDNNDEFSNSELFLDEDKFEWTVTLESEADLPPGFYYNILGMVQGEIKFFVIPSNIDVNGDGIDDITKIPVWDNPLQQYNLKFVVEILDIL